MYGIMNKSWIFAALAVIILIAALCLWILWSKETPEVRSAANRDTPRLPENVALTSVRQQGNVAIARLQNPSQIDGFPCAAGWVHFGESGRLRAFYLGETVVLQGNEIPKGTWVRLNPDLTIKFCAFPQHTNIQGYLCRGGVGGSEGVTTGLYPSGRLESFFPPENIEIQGIQCRATPFGPVYLYENGGLKEFTLARDAVIGGRALDGGQTVILGENGEVQSVRNPSTIERIRSWVTKIF